MHEIEQQLESYDADHIEVLEGLQPVRVRPGMYIGSTGINGLHHLVYEIVDNSVDEAGAGFCKDVTLEILPDQIIRVVDDGRGIPTGIHSKEGIAAATLVFTVLHAGGKFSGKSYKKSGGLHGVGSSVVNALSEWLEVRIYDGKHVHFQRFERGEYHEPLKIIGETSKCGTEVTFRPDATIFETIEFKYETLLNRMREQAFLNAGIRIHIRDKRGETPIGEDLCYEGGIKQFVDFLQGERECDTIGEVIYVSGEKDDAFAEIALQYNTSYKEEVYSFANTIHTGDGGSHETGFRNALLRVMNHYCRAFGFLKEKDSLKHDDVREGLTAIVSVKLTECQFEGQTKGKLGNTEVKSLVDNIVYERLYAYFEANPQQAREIVDKCLSTKKAREAASAAKEQSRKKTAMENSSLPGKLADCSEKGIERTELYIVEGDSAGGSAKGGRDRKYQAILPLWGKMLNVEKAREDRVYGNDKLMPVVTALGTGIGSDFDIGKLRYGKVIIMADADVDGCHIRTLLLTFFFRFLRPLVENGNVYIAQPPLYKVSRGKEFSYAFTDEERDRQIEELQKKKPEGKVTAKNAKISVQRYKGLGEMDSEQLWETTMNPETRTIVKVTLTDAMRADQIISILMGDKVAPRKNYIEAHAKSVVNLDV